MAERDMTRRVFLGLATAGLGAAAGGVATSLITTNMNQRAAEKQAIEEEQAAVEGDRSNVTTDNVGTSDNAAESIASPQAEPVEIDPAPETPRYDSWTHTCTTWTSSSTRTAFPPSARPWTRAA